MTLKKFAGLAAIAGLVSLVASPPLQAQLTQRWTYIANSAGQAVTTALYGSIRAFSVVLIDPATNAPVAYVSDTRAAGNSNATTMRTVEATDSQLSDGVGPTSASAATAGSTGSLNAKLRFLTQTAADALTALQAIDDDQTGGSGCSITSAASTNATNCKASAGRIMAMGVINTTTTTYYLRIYNLAASPTCSSATGFVQTWPIPPGGAAGQAGGLTISFGSAGRAYATGIGYCLTGGSSSTDNTNAATGVFGEIVYK